MWCVLFFVFFIILSFLLGGLVRVWVVGLNFLLVLVWGFFWGVYWRLESYFFRKEEVIVGRIGNVLWEIMLEMSL